MKHSYSWATTRQRPHVAASHRFTWTPEEELASWRDIPMISVAAADRLYVDAFAEMLDLKARDRTRETP